MIIIIVFMRTNDLDFMQMRTFYLTVDNVFMRLAWAIDW